ANPHDSLGELFVLLGRWDEAKGELEQALRIRPDFCTSYGDLAEIARLTGHPEQLTAIQERGAQQRRGAEWLGRSKCFGGLWKSYLARDWEALTRDFDTPCVQKGWV